MRDEDAKSEDSATEEPRRLNPRDLERLAV